MFAPFFSIAQWASLKTFLRITVWFINNNIKKFKSIYRWHQVIICVVQCAGVSVTFNDISRLIAKSRNEREGCNWKPVRWHVILLFINPMCYYLLLLLYKAVHLFLIYFLLLVLTVGNKRPHVLQPHSSSNRNIWVKSPAPVDMH